MKGCTHGLHLGVQSSYVSSFPSAPQDRPGELGPQRPLGRGSASATWSTTWGTV